MSTFDMKREEAPAHANFSLKRHHSSEEIEREREERKRAVTDPFKRCVWCRQPGAFIKVCYASKLAFLAYN